MKSNISTNETIKTSYKQGSSTTGSIEKIKTIEKRSNSPVKNLTVAKAQIAVNKKSLELKHGKICQNKKALSPKKRKYTIHS